MVGGGLLAVADAVAVVVVSGRWVDAASVAVKWGGLGEAAEVLPRQWLHAAYWLVAFAEAMQQLPSGGVLR